jgi:hypothetical protein
VSPPRTAFYCVADARYFLGAVGLINSLRLVGHAEPIYLLDCGLTADQRKLLERHVTVVPAPSGTPPWLLKTVLPRTHPAAVRVLIDADILVTRPLTELIETASRGRILAFESRLDGFTPEWGELLDLGPIRRRRYLSSAVVVLGGPVGEEVLALWDDRQSRVEFEQTHWRRSVRGYPFLYADQDVLNAVLASEVAAGRVDTLAYRLSPTPPFEGLEVADEAALRCAYEDGVEAYAVHFCLEKKPWLEPAHDRVYSQLLRRCLLGTDVPVRVAEADLPWRLRSGPLAAAERLRVNALESVRWHLAAPIARRVRALRAPVPERDR